MRAWCAYTDDPQRNTPETRPRRQSRREQRHDEDPADRFDGAACGGGPDVCPRHGPAERVQHGVLLAERSDPAKGEVLRRWLTGSVKPAFADRIVSVDAAVVVRAAALHERWSRSPCR